MYPCLEKSTTGNAILLPIFYKERRVLWVHLWIVGNWLGRCNFQSMHFCEKSRLCRIYNFCRNIKVRDMEIRIHSPQSTNCYGFFEDVWLHCFSWWYNKWQGKGMWSYILSLPSEIKWKYTWRNTPARTCYISGLKFRVLKSTFLKSIIYLIFYFEIHRAPELARQVSRYIWRGSDTPWIFKKNLDHF